MTPVWKQRFGCGYAAPGARWRAACQSRDSSLSKRMGGVPHPQPWPSLPLPHLDPPPPATRTHRPPPFPVFHTRHAEQSAERPRLVTVVRPCDHSTLRKVTLLLNRRSVVSYEQLLLDVSEALGFPHWHRARVTRLYTPHAREVRGVCDFFRGEAAFLALGKSRPELRSVEEALEELFPQHSCYCNDALRAWERRLRPSPDKAAKADSGYSEGTDTHTHSVPHTQGRNLDTHTHTHQNTLTQPNTYPNTQIHPNTHLNRHPPHKNKHPTRQSIHPIHTHLNTDTHTHPNTHSNRNSTHPSHPPNHLQRVIVKVGARKILSSPTGPLTQEEELGEELDTPPPPRCRNCKPSVGPNPRAGRAPLPPVTKKQTGNRPNNQEVEKPHVGPAPRHTGPICRSEQESLSQSERSSSYSKQEEVRTKQEVIFDLPSDGSDVTLSDIERCYDIGRMVGDGNFAVVHECRRRDNGVAFAVKIVEHSKLIGREHMMQNELSLLGSLSHPRVVRLFTHHHTHTHSYLVMEMVAGGDLFEAIAERGKFPEEEAGLMVCDVSEALRYIHSKTIVHRDLKPENLLVECSSDGVSRLKLGDFGLAMVVTEPIFTVCGTPTYVAPEILLETGYGLPVDLWALGVILYVLLCGFPPFRSRDRDQEKLFQLIREAHLTFLSPYWDDISDGARGLVRALLQVDPKERLTAAQTLKHPWIQTTTDQYRPVQISTDQYRPTQISTDQQSPAQPSKDQHRYEQINANQQSPAKTSTEHHRPAQSPTIDQYQAAQTTTKHHRPVQSPNPIDQQRPAQPSKEQHRSLQTVREHQNNQPNSTHRLPHLKPSSTPTRAPLNPHTQSPQHTTHPDSPLSSLPHPAGPINSPQPPSSSTPQPPHPIPPAHHPSRQPPLLTPPPCRTHQLPPAPQQQHPSTPTPNPPSTPPTQTAPSPHSPTLQDPSTPPSPPAAAPLNPHTQSPQHTTHPDSPLSSLPHPAGPINSPQPPSSSTSQPPHPISPPSVLSTPPPKPSSHPPCRTPQSALPLYPASLPPTTHSASLATPNHSQPNTHLVQYPHHTPTSSVPPRNSSTQAPLPLNPSS